MFGINWKIAKHIIFFCFLKCSLLTISPLVIITQIWKKLIYFCYLTVDFIISPQYFTWWAIVCSFECFFEVINIQIFHNLQNFLWSWIAKIAMCVTSPDSYTIIFILKSSAICEKIKRNWPSGTILFCHKEKVKCQDIGWWSQEILHINRRKE